MNWVDICFDWNQSNTTFIKHRHDCILNELPSCLICIGLQSKTIVQAGMNGFFIALILVESNMHDFYSGSIHSYAVIYSSNDGPVISTT